jgi:thioredoxin 1
VLRSQEPVLVEVWAEWCAPCRQIAPTLDEIAREMDGKLKIAKINIDENPSTPSRYGVRAIPTLMIFKGGQQVGQQVGVVPKSKLVDWIKSSI